MDPGVIVWTALAGLSLASLLVGRPWTVAKARRAAPPAVRETAAFRETNRVLTAGWTLYFAAAAGISLIGPAWASWAPAIPTPLLGKLSQRLGPRLFFRFAKEGTA